MSSIIAFPDSLRSSIKKNSGNHLSFEIKDGIDPKQNTKIHLYIPSGFSLGDGANFSNVDLGVISGLERLNNARKNAAEGASQADVVATMGEGQAIGAALMKALSIGNQFNAGQAAQIKTGVTLNPATTLAYDGSALRQFELNFRLIAESAKEAETIRLIEHTFRKAMYAKLEGSIALKYPPLFKIKFMKGKEPNKFLPFLYDSYLTGLNATYNSDSNMYHADGAPTDVTLSLSFQEQKQLTQDDLYHDKGGAGDEEETGSEGQQNFDSDETK